MFHSFYIRFPVFLMILLHFAQLSTLFSLGYQDSPGPDLFILHMLPKVQNLQPAPQGTGGEAVHMIDRWCLSGAYVFPEKQMLPE